MAHGAGSAIRSGTDSLYALSLTARRRLASTPGFACTRSGLDPHSITWRRCLDMDDRVLRQVVVGLGARTNGVPRETGFDIDVEADGQVSGLR